MRHAARTLLIPLVCLAAAGAPPAARAQALPQADAQDASPPGTTFPELTYAVTFSTVEDGDLEEALAVSSNLLQQQDNPPPSVVGLARRAAEDTDRMLRTLRSLGYYAGTVDIFIEGIPLGDPRLREVTEGDEPVQVWVEVRPGPQYRIASIGFEQLASAPSPEPIRIARDELDLHVGDAAVSADILRAEQVLIGQMKRQGHPFASVPDRRAVVDHARHTMDLTFGLGPGPRAALGEVTIAGLDQVDAGFVRNRVPFEPGELYSPEQLSDLRERLTALGVFSSVRVEPARSLAADGTLPVAVTVVERPPRVVGFGLRLSSLDGFGADAYWQHRNLFGQAEQLRIEASVARIKPGAIGADILTEIDYGLSFSFRKPDFLMVDQDLVARLAVLAERPDAFDRQAIEGSVGIERRLSDAFSFTAGVEASIERLREQDDEETETYTFVGLPVTATYDGTDDRLDPTRGARAKLSVTPYPTFLGSSQNLLVSRLDASAYTDFGTDRRLVLAGRTSLGSVLGGSDTDDVPASRRFYAGGGGSVRGYEFQSVGPLDDDDDPVGGRSLFEASLELRYKITDTIGIVPFIDAGQVFDAPFPDFSEAPQYAAGLGLRYYTGFGPLRLDIAAPLNPRPSDDFVAVYLSLGQAF